MIGPSELIAANDEQDVVDLLIRAHAICKDMATRELIELALIREGRKISRQLQRPIRSA